MRIKWWFHIIRHAKVTLATCSLYSSYQRRLPYLMKKNTLRNKDRSQARSVNSIKTGLYCSCYGIVSLEQKNTTIVKSFVVKVTIRRQAGIINYQLQVRDDSGVF
jgi:hypothetical protein